MRPVAVIGAGKTPFGAFPEQDLRTLAVEAAEKALHNANTGKERHSNPFTWAISPGRNSPPEPSGALHHVRAGMLGIPATRFEAACASSGAAFFPGVHGRGERHLRRRYGGRGREDDQPANPARH